MKRIFAKIHLWLGIPFGLFITCICLSGAALIFEAEIQRAIHPEFYHVAQTSSHPRPMAELLRTAAQALPDSVVIGGITVAPDNPEMPYRIDISHPRRAVLVIDQYTGQILGTETKLPFFAETVKLHRRLFDKATTPNGNPSTGKLIVGVSTCVFVLALLTGLLIWWPRSRKALTNSLKIPLRHGSHRFWLGLHDAGGIYALIFLLAMSLTGLTWSFKWYSHGFYSLFGEDSTATPRGSMSKVKKGEQRTDADYDVWQTVFDYLNETDCRTITISDGKATVAVHSGNPRAADVFKFDKTTAQITDVTPYAETSRMARLRGWVYAIHTGQWCGIWSKIISFIAALIGASLPLTGYYLWLRRRKKMPTVQHSRH